MTVNNGKIVVVILLAYKAAGVLAEGSDLVLERTGITDKLRFVKNIVYLFDDLVSDLDSDADVNGSGEMLDIMLFAHILKPVGTLSARCYDYVVGGNGKFFALRLTARKEYRAFCSAARSSCKSANVSPVD